MPAGGLTLGRVGRAPVERPRGQVIDVRGIDLEPALFRFGQRPHREGHLVARDALPLGAPRRRTLLQVGQPAFDGAANVGDGDFGRFRRWGGFGGSSGRGEQERNGVHEGYRGGRAAGAPITAGHASSFHRYYPRTWPRYTVTTPFGTRIAPAGTSFPPRAIAASAISTSNHSCVSP